MSGWDEDIDKIRKSGPIRADVIAAWDQVKPLLIAAWQHGYTTGMTDSAKIDKLAADEARQRGLVWNPMKMNYDPAPE